MYYSDISKRLAYYENYFLHIIISIITSCFKNEVKAGFKSKMRVRKKGKQYKPT